jgi:hypothetical protein
MTIKIFLWVIGLVIFAFIGYRFNKFCAEKRSEGDRIALEHFENLKNGKDGTK